MRQAAPWDCEDHSRRRAREAGGERPREEPVGRSGEEGAAAGADARRQAPDLGDVLLHETVVSMFCTKMRQTRPVVAPWLETLPQWTERARRAIKLVNSTFCS